MAIRILIAYGYTDYVIILGLLPDLLYGLLATLFAHWEVLCDRWCDSSRYYVPSAILTIYPVWSVVQATRAVN